MTIFDIRPYSYWRNLHRVAHRAWAHLGQDTPRSVCELTLLREVNRRLTTELAETAARLSAEQRYRRREVTRQNERLTAATDRAERRGKLLREVMEENQRMAAMLTANQWLDAIGAPQCNVFAIASTNTHASGETCENDGVACVTEGAKQHV